MGRGSAEPGSTRQLPTQLTPFPAPHSPAASCSAATSWHPPRLIKKERGRLPSRHQNSSTLCPGQPGDREWRDFGLGQGPVLQGQGGVFPGVLSLALQRKGGQGGEGSPSSFPQEVPSHFPLYSPPATTPPPTPTHSQKSASGSRAMEIERESSDTLDPSLGFPCSSCGPWSDPTAPLSLSSGSVKDPALC